MSYTHITQKEIIATKIYLEEWYCISEIAKKLWRNKSTIARLLQKWKNPSIGEFDITYLQAQKEEAKNKSSWAGRKKVLACSYQWITLRVFICTYIQQYWSPTQIAIRWKKETGQTIGKDTIYAYVYTTHPEYVKPFLRRKGKKYIHRRKEKYALNNRKMIDERPEYIEQRKSIWHWEGDTIIWKNHQWAIFTNVERKTGFLLTQKLSDRSALSVENAFRATFENVPKYKKKTTTVDNGREFANHTLVEYFTGTTVYFAHPYSPWERWSNENTNGLLRQFIPKSSDFSLVSRQDLAFFTDLINMRPRLRLDALSPFEAFYNTSISFVGRCASF